MTDDAPSKAGVIGRRGRKARRTPQEGELDDAIREILDTALRQIDGTRLTATTKLLSSTILRGLTSGQDYSRSIARVQRAARDIRAINRILEECSEAIQAKQESVIAKNPGSDIWWKARTEGIERATSDGLPDLASRLWLTVWVESLALQDWDRASRVVTLKGLAKGAEPIGEEAATVVAALKRNDLASAVPALTRLLDPSAPFAGFVDPANAVRLGALHARILVREPADRQRALAAATELVMRSTDHEAESNDAQSLARSVLAEMHLAVDEPAQARIELKSALTRPAPPTDALVVQGILLERESLWSLADEQYDRAVESDQMAISPVLLRPVPPRLLIRAALQPSVDPERSVALLERALRDGAGSLDDATERGIYLTKGRCLRRWSEQEEDAGHDSAAWRRRHDAAQSLFEAGNRYSLAGLRRRALELYQEACALNPGVTLYQWNLAEELRLEAHRPDGTIDKPTMARARSALRAGLPDPPGNPTESWVLITQAMIELESPPPTADSVLLAERALLANPDDPVTLAFLALILRRKGLSHEALEALNQIPSLIQVPDPFVFDSYLDLCVDVENYHRALQLIDDHALLNPGDSDADAHRRAAVLYHMGDVDGALRQLPDRRQSDHMRILRGACLFTRGDTKESKREFLALWNDTQNAQARDVAGWAAFRAGRTADGIEIYRALVPHASSSSPIPRDLGQMLLVAGDVAEGEQLLHAGINSCTEMATLRNLDVNELHFVLHSTAALDHRDEVAACVARLRAAIGRRLATLHATRLGPDAPAAPLLQARRAFGSGEPLAALDRYLALLGGDPNLPEIESAVIRAADEARRLADREHAAGSEKRALDQWQRAAAGLTEAATALDDPIRLGLACRIHLAALLQESASDQAPPGGTWSPPQVQSAVADAVDAVASTVDQLWRLHDGLRASTASASADLPAGEFARTVNRLAASLPIQRIYRLDAQDNQQITDSAFLFAHPLELRLGSELARLCGSTDLEEGVRRMRERIEEDCGVRVAPITPAAARKLPERQADVRVFGRWVGQTVLSEGPERFVSEIVSVLERCTRAYLFRFIGVEDVQLWLERWEIAGPNDSGPRMSGTVGERLRLARVLRMLLREGVPVKDRAAILDALQVGALRSDPASSTLETLHQVRRRLGSRGIGLPDDAVMSFLPAYLERAISSGISPTRPRWEMPRIPAHALVLRLREWRNEQPDGAVIGVESSRVRPFVWRLLAAGGSPVVVVSKDEFNA